MGNLVTKQCSDCGLSKPVDQFHRHSKRPDGRFPNCKRCKSKAMRKLRLDNPDRMRTKDHANNLKQRYGIDIRIYNEMLDMQNGRCAICSTSKSNSGRTEHFLVDHDHETGRVRGLLCHGCNIGLGGFRDDPAYLRAAIDYVISG